MAKTIPHEIIDWKGTNVACGQKFTGDDTGCGKPFYVYLEDVFFGFDSYRARFPYPVVRCPHCGKHNSIEVEIPQRVWNKIRDQHRHRHYDKRALQEREASKVRTKNRKSK